jgi:hypothetical protein
MIDQSHSSEILDMTTDNAKKLEWSLYCEFEDLKEK